jgi:hypothetical protein
MANLAPIKSDFFVGADKTVQVIVYSTLPTTAAPAGVRQNITGWTFEWDLRTTPQATGVPLVKKTGGQITIADAPNGVVNVAVLRTDTVGLAPGTYHHTLWRVDSGANDAVAYGPAELTQSDFH